MVVNVIANVLSNTFFLVNKPFKEELFPHNNKNQQLQKYSALLLSPSPVLYVL